MTTSSIRRAIAMQMLEQSVVVFSQNYLSLCQVNLKRAIVLLVTNKAERLGFPTQGGWRVHSPSLVIDVPKHIFLKIAFNEQIWKFPLANQRKMLRFDHHSCQYCDNDRYLTLDDVVPQSKSSSHTWNQVVTASERCNSRKGDRSPLEAGMQLRKAPKTSVHQAISFIVSEAWRNSATQFWINVQANLE